MFLTPFMVLLAQWGHSATAISPIAVDESGACSVSRPNVGQQYIGMGSGFVENVGQATELPGARFLVRRGAFRAEIHANRIDVSWPAATESTGQGSFPKARCTATLQFLGASPEAHVVGEDALPHNVNYLGGDSLANSDSWPAIRAFRSAKIEGLYPGLDLRIHESNGRLEYDVICENREAISLLVVRISGPVSLDMFENGRVRGEFGIAYFLQDSARSYLGSAPGEHPIDCEVVALCPDTFTFRIPSRVSDRLTIDPILEFGTYLGGSGSEELASIDVDTAGSIFVTGYSNWSDYPITPGVFQPTVPPSGGPRPHGVVTQLKNDGSALVYSTYIQDVGLRSIRMDVGGAAHLCGSIFWDLQFSQSPPLTPGAFDTTYPGLTDYTAWFGKLSPAGDSLVYGSYLGSRSLGRAVDVDTTGHAYLGGSACAKCPFPTTPGAYVTGLPNYISATDAYIVKVSLDGSNLLFGSLFGGLDYDTIQVLKLAPDGSICVGGSTLSKNFPMLPNSFQPTFGGGDGDAFVFRLSADGSTPTMMTYLGGQSSSAEESVWGLAVDKFGSIYVTGQVIALSTFITTPDAFSTIPTPCFVTKFTPDGASLEYSTFIGTPSILTVGNSLTLDRNGHAILLGLTGASMPMTPGAFKTSFPGSGGDPFMVVLNGFGSGLLYGTFCGAGFETGEDGASVCVDSSESIYVAGWTNSPFYPVTPGAFDTLLNIAGPTPPFSAFDGFIQKHASVPPSSLPGVVAFGAGTPGCQGPIQLRVNSTPKTNNPLFEFNCLNAPPKSLGLLLLSNERDGAGSDALGLGVAFHVGLYTPELYALDTPSTALGSGTTRLAIPNDPALVNRLYFAQAFWVWPAGGCQPTPSGLSSSNGVALTIQP